MFPLNSTNNQYIILDIPQNNSLLCCRACLATDGKLFNIHEYKLADTFSWISGTPIFKDQLPQYLCSYCHTLLLKCASYRAMCVRTQQHLTAELLKGELNTASILRMNQPSRQFFELSITKCEIVDCAPVEKNGPEKYIKAEPNTDAVETKSILKNSHQQIKLENKLDEFKVSDVKQDINVKGKNIKRKNTNMTNSSRKKTEIKKIKTEANINAVFENACDSDDIYFVVNLKHESNNPIGTVNQRAGDFNGIKDKLSLGVADVGIQKANSVKKRKVIGKKERKNIAKKNMKINAIAKRKEKEQTMKKSFENEYSVEFHILSKEEQRAELAARKTTANYIESDFKCEKCYKGFELKASYENHMLRHSESTGAHECEICHIRFPNNRVRLKHQRIHCYKIRCTQCQFVSRTKTQAKQHFAMHTGKTYSCPHCGKSFQKSNSVLTHIRLYHPALNAACDLCGEVFVGENGLKLHKARMHSEKIKCSICSAKFVNLAALNRHTDTAGEHSDLRPCEQCGENCASEEALQKHKEEKHPKESHRCEQCDMAFPTSKAYDTHIRRKHLLQGIQQTRRYKRYRPRDTPADPEKKYMCEQCGRIFPHKSRLTSHQHSHLGIKPYACNHCSKTFALKQNLITHLRSHTGETPFQCGSCPRAFSLKKNLDRHHTTVHLGIRGSFLCGICGSTATTRSTLRVHVDSKHGGKGWPRTRKRKQTDNK